MNGLPLLTQGADIAIITQYLSSTEERMYIYETQCIY